MPDENFLFADGKIGFHLIHFFAHTGIFCDRVQRLFFAFFLLFYLLLLHCSDTHIQLSYLVLEALDLLHAGLR